MVVETLTALDGGVGANRGKFRQSSVCQVQSQEVQEFPCPHHS